MDGGTQPQFNLIYNLIFNTNICLLSPANQNNKFKLHKVKGIQDRMVQNVQISIKTYILQIYFIYLFTINQSTNFHLDTSQETRVL